MGNNNMVSLELNEDMVKPVLEKQIQAAVLANIGNPEELIAKCVSIALKQKVDSDGEISNSSYDNKHDFLEVFTGKAIRAAAQESLRGWLNENIRLVREKVLEELNKPERQESMAKAFADAVEDSLKLSWRFQCDVSFKRNE